MTNIRSASEPDTTADTLSEWAALSMRFSSQGHRLLTLISERHGILTNHCRTLEHLSIDLIDDNAVWASGVQMMRDVLGEIPTTVYLSGRGSGVFAYQSGHDYAPFTLRKMGADIYEGLILPLWESLATVLVFDPDKSSCFISDAVYRRCRAVATSTCSTSFLLTKPLSRDHAQASRVTVPKRNAVPVEDRAQVGDITSTLSNRPSIGVASSREIYVHTDASRDGSCSEDFGYGLGIAIQDAGADRVEFYSCYEIPDHPYQSQRFELSGALRALEVLARGYDVQPGATLTVHLYCDNDWAVNQINKLVGCPTASARRLLLQESFPEEDYHADASWLNNPGIHVQASWVKGHVGSAFNVACDSLATSARLSADGMRSAPEHSRLLEDLQEELGSTFAPPKIRKPGRNPRNAHSDAWDQYRQSVVSDHEVPSELQTSAIGPLAAPEKIEISVATVESDESLGYALGLMLHDDGDDRLITSFEPYCTDQERLMVHVAGAVRALCVTIAAHRLVSDTFMSVTVHSTDFGVVKQVNLLFATDDPERRLQLFRKLLDSSATTLPAWMTDTNIAVTAVLGKRADRGGALSNARSVARKTLGQHLAVAQWKTLEEVNDAASRRSSTVLTSA